jgi:hypothetical protein
MRFDSLEDKDIFLNNFFLDRKFIAENVYEVSPNGYIIVDGKRIGFLMSEQWSEEMNDE